MVTVILPFFNAENTLAAAIQSVVDQTYFPDCILLIDNLSTDRSRLIAQKFAALFPSITLLTEAKPGVSHAMNHGLSMVKSGWIARMDADDIWYPGKLAAQLKYLSSHPEVAVLGTQVEYRSFLSRSDGLAYYVEWSNSCITAEQIANSIFIESPMVNPSLMFHASLMEKYGMYTTDSIPEDYEMLLRWHLHKVGMAKIESALMIWNDYSNRLTRTNPNYSHDAFNRIKSAYLSKHLSVVNEQHPGVWIWGSGRKTRQKLRQHQANGIQVLGFIDFMNGELDGKPILDFREVAVEKVGFVVSMVSNRGKGQEIRAYLLSKGFKEGSQFIIAG